MAYKPGSLDKLAKKLNGQKRKYKATKAKHIKFVTGDKALDQKLAELAVSSLGITKRAVNKGMTVLLQEQRRQAPVGESSALKKSLGKRFEKKKRSDTIVGKVGINVAKKPSRSDGKPMKGAQAPYGHIPVLGTGDRQRKSGGKTGRVKPNPFIKRAAEAKTSAMQAVIRQSVDEQLQKQAARKGRKRR